MVLHEAVACQLDPERKIRNILENVGKKTTIGTSHEKEIDILWSCIHKHQESELMKWKFQGKV